MIHSLQPPLKKDFWFRGRSWNAGRGTKKVTVPRASLCSVRHKTAAIPRQPRPSHREEAMLQAGRKPSAHWQCWPRDGQDRQGNLVMPNSQVTTSSQPPQDTPAGKAIRVTLHLLAHFVMSFNSFWKTREKMSRGLFHSALNVPYFTGDGKKLRWSKA